MMYTCKTHACDVQGDSGGKVIFCNIVRQ